MQLLYEQDEFPTTQKTWNTDPVKYMEETNHNVSLN